MDDSNKLDIVIKSLRNLITDKKIEQYPPKELLQIEGFEFLYNTISELRKAITSIGSGELDYHITTKGYLPGVVKAMQASMKHLAWYTKAVSSGDFTQRIDFMGELADDFNQMTKQLELNFNEISRLESEAREAKEHFEQIFSTSPEPTVITRLSDGLIENVNQVFCDVFGYKMDESIGKLPQELGIYENCTDRQKLINEIKTKGACKNLKVILRKKSGERMVALMSAKIIKLKDVLHLIIVTRDITLKDQLKEALRKSEEKYRTLFENAVEMINVFQNGKIKICNQIAEEITGYSKEELLACESVDFIHPDDRQQVINDHRRRLKGEVFDNNSSIFRILKKDNTIRWIEMKSIKIEWENEDATLNLLSDITEREVAKLELEKSEEQMRQLIMQMREGLAVHEIICDHNGKPVDYRFLDVNKSFEILTGFRREDIIGKKVTEVLPKVEKYWIETYGRVAITGEPCQFENYSDELGKYYCVSAYSPKKNQFAVIMSDITEKKIAEEEIQFLSYHDQLTGLYNRRFYEQEIERLNDDKECYPLSIIMADLNGLKLTNDAFGHTAGDNLLISAAKILKRECGKNNIIARIGGDEFVILLSNTDAAATSSIINRINQAVENENIENAILSISMGYAVKKDISDDVNEIFKEAEDDMYRHKLSKSADMKRRTIERVINKFYKNNIEMLHSKNVSEICEAIAYELKLNPEAIKKIKLAGRMHDIGKVAVDSNLFNKPGRLSREEWTDVKRHPEIGYRILNSADEFSDIARFVLEHHEKWNGSGYPKGLKENEISLQARIIAIADSFDVMTSERPYRKTLTVEEAVKEIRTNAGIKFDPYIVEIFIDKVLKKIQKTLDE